MPPPKTPEQLAEEMTLLYQDEHVAVVNKPSGMLVHRGWDRDRIVAMTALRDLLDTHVYPVHRLDRPTSGAVIFALNVEAARSLSHSFEKRLVDKRYLALVRGITPESGTIDYPIHNQPRRKGPRVPAVTDFERLDTFERFSLVEARPLTGRLHQIRRHLRHITHPLIGDISYGTGDLNRRFRADFGLYRLALHALEITIPHPVTGESLKVGATLPSDLAEPLQKMGLKIPEPSATLDEA
ncbi:MAG TPA: pseudouridylate synthase [Myxococcales bacterium]|nr:pseudouridylate synthase [Myxococcales bacterium]HIN84854.1 pseudouridylate synthase [Myxococcales bacterium]